jgi:hypothetical protein
MKPDAEECCANMIWIHSRTITHNLSQTVYGKVPYTFYTIQYCINFYCYWIAWENSLPIMSTFHHILPVIAVISHVSKPKQQMFLIVLTFCGSLLMYVCSVHISLCLCKVKPLVVHLDELLNSLHVNHKHQTAIRRLLNILDIDVCTFV